jgi:hypothetical protein
MPTKRRLFLITQRYNPESRTLHSHAVRIKNPTRGFIPEITGIVCCFLFQLIGILVSPCT